MKKIYSLIFALLFSITSFSQIEGFEGAVFPPTGWAVFDNGVSAPTNLNWTTNAAACQETLSAYMNRQNVGQNNTSEDYLAMPQLTVPLNGQLRFTGRSFVTGDAGTLYLIKVKLATGSAVQNDPTGYSIIQTWTEITMPNVCTEYVVDLNAYAGLPVYIAFVMKNTQTAVGPTGDRWLVDNVQIVAQCFPPTALAATPLSTSATFNWTGSGVSFEIENLPAATPPTGVATGTSATNTFNQTGLTPNTNYCYYVRAVCGPGNTSTWAGPFCYTTQIAPPVCGGNFVDSGGVANNYGNNENSTITILPTAGNQVTVTFTSFSTATGDILTVFEGTPPVQIAQYSGNLPVPFSITSAAANGALTFNFTSNNDFTTQSGWTSSITCIPPPACATPSAVATSAILATSATLSWTQIANPDGSTATNWQVIALPQGSPAPTNTSPWINTTINPYNFVGLTPLTCYDVYIRAACSLTEFSPITGPKTVCTSALPPICGGNFIDTGGLGGSTTTSDQPGNYQNNENYTTTICPVNPGDQVTVTFTTFNTEANWDGFYIYDGNNTLIENQIPSANGLGNINGPFNIIPGGWWGNTIPGPFTSSSPDGCLTFVFLSDGSVNREGFVANITCAPAPTCSKPITVNVTGVTDTLATLNWTQPANPDGSFATAWQVIALPCGSPIPTVASPWINTTTNPHNFTGLSADTCYDFYVQAICSPTDSSPIAGPKTATTLLTPPACGGVFTDTGGSGDNYQDSENITTIICPTPGSGDLVTVTFTSFNTETNWDGLYVYDGNAVVAGNQISSNNGPGNGGLTIPGAYWGTTIPGPFTSSSTDGCLTFVFISDFSFNNPGWTANVTCAPPPTCRKPNALASTSLTLTGATISWTQLPNPDTTVANNWQVLILPAGSAAPTASTTGWIATTSNPFVATGLNQATCYDYYVRAVCSATDSSTWAGPKSFCTLIPNDECTGAIVALTNPGQNCTNITNGSLIGATQSQASSCSFGGGNDVWFQFTATSSNHSFNLNDIVGGPAFNLGYAVYSGTCNALTEISCVNNTSGTLSGLTSGQTYYVQVTQDSFSTANYTFSLCIGTLPPVITTNDTQYTNEQLVTDVLFNSSCATVTNVTTSTGTNFGSTNGIGYFNQNGSSFPFEDGVILTSGNIATSPGPNTTIQSVDFAEWWPGDNDLFNYIQGLGIDPFLTDYNNATILEFDFVPLIDNISFDFIFASEEYGTFQCTFSDAFAFFLTNNTSGVTTNLAVVPTTNDPISVLTIRDGAFNGNCGSVNPDYFADFYQLPAPGLNPLASPTNFNGSTIPMTATSAVIPGQQYHIKLVVADRNDGSLNSAVFLKGGSFDFGLELGIDFLISGDNALCPGTQNLLTTGLSPTLYTFVWTENGTVIDGQTGPTLLIDHTGTYEVTATLIGTSCSASDLIVVEYYDQIVLPTPNNLTACNSTGYAQFNLLSNNPSILGTLSPAAYTVTYYLTQADATAEVNPLPNNYTNVVPFLQTIYVRVENVAGCFATSQFNLVIQDLTPQFTITPSFTICEGTTGTISVTPINFNLVDATYTWTLNTSPLAVNTPTISVTQPGTYNVVVNNSGCTANASTVITTNICEISTYASAVWIQDCTTPTDGKFFNTSGSGADLINQDGSVFAMNYGVHIQNSNTLVLRGAELKTQKTASSNICNARMNYRIFPTGNIPGVFTPWDLPFFSDCNTGTGTFITGGGPCAAGQQKWQCVSQPGCTAPVDLTAFAPGNYTIQVYYDINGSFNTTNGCADNLVLNNAGNYYTANFTIQSTSGITSTDPTTCNGSDGTITINNLVPNQTYAITYNDDGTIVGPANFTSNATGEIIINGLNAGIYHSFNSNINSCNTQILNAAIVLINPALPVVTVNNPVICSGASGTVTATPEVAGNYNYVWTVPAGFTNPGNVASFNTTVAGNYTVVITPINAALCNLSFETPTATGNFPNLFNENIIPCWDTTASDGIMEVWPPAGFEGVFAYQGNQFIEMNGNSVATIFQDFTVSPGSTLDISFAHRGRQGNDVVRVEIGPVGGPYVNLGQFTDGNTAWVLHNINYTIPANNGSNYSLRFVSVSSTGGDPSVGNFLDAISVSIAGCSSLPTTGIVSLLPNVTLALTSANNNQSPCNNTAITDIIFSTVNATDVTFAGLPSGLSGTFNAGVFTISGAPTEGGIFNYTVSTVGGCLVATATGTISVIVIPAPTTSITTQPTCLSPTGTVEITSPLSNIVNVPSDLFISEVTDSQAGSLTYIEIFNGTGVTKNLSDYKLKIYNNGNTFISTGCDMILSGTIANNTTNVIKVSTDANQGGVIANQVFSACGGVNTNDNIKLTNSSDVVIDNWGRSDGVDYTPSNQTGYTYRRLSSALPLPFTGWNTSHWTTFDPEDYTNVGSYIPVNNNQYLYNVDGGTYTTNTTFAGLSPGSHTFTVQDPITGCVSAGTEVILTLNPIDPVINPFSYTTPVCYGNITLTPDYGTSGIIPDGTFSSTAGLDINPTTGIITVISSTPGTYLITYSPALCSSIALLPFTVVIDPVMSSTFNTITVCQDDVVTFPTLSNEGNSGTWSSPSIDTSVAGTYIYTFTPTVGICAATGTLTVIVNPKATSTFNTINICQDGVIAFPTQSNEGNSGTWSSTSIDTSVVGTFIYTFTPSVGICAATGTLTVIVNPKATSTFNTINICQDGVIAFPTQSNEGNTGTWSSTSINTSVGGTFTYTFIPSVGICAATGTLTVVVNPKINPTFNPIAILCIGELAPALPLTSTNSTPITGTWSSATIDTTTSGTFIYVFTPAATECANPFNLSVTVQSSFDYTVTDECIGSSYTITITDQPANATYTWQIGTTTILGESGATFNVTNYLNSTTTNETLPLTFNVIVENTDGCTHTETIIIDNISCQIQNGISANGDGDNDSFDLSQLDVAKLEIFNRYGVKVYSRVNYTNEWVGQTDKGEELPDGTYYYMIEFNSKDEPKSGWIYINRKN